MTRPDQSPPRREVKYFIDRRRLPEVWRDLQTSCNRDPNAGRDGTYLVTSLYFGSPSLDLPGANDADWFKARVRAYPEVMESPVFGELKTRLGNLISKSRTRLPTDDWTRDLQVDPTLQHSAFVSRIRQYGLRPAVLVECRREAWASRDEEFARVSIDTSIRCQATDQLSLLGNPSRWRPLNHPLMASRLSPPCVVELKWADRAPAWMVRLAETLKALRVRQPQASERSGPAGRRP